jgi:hypothetical protein
VHIAPAFAAAASKVQEGLMFNVLAKLVQDGQGNLTVRAAPHIRVHLLV